MRRLGGLVALLVVSGAYGCAGSSGESKPAAAKDTRLARGGTLVMKSVDDLETLDPGMSSSVMSSLVIGLVHRPLYSFFPGDTRPDPDLAAGPPQISADGRTVTVKLRRGVRFGEPVNREVRADDVRYGVERIFTENVLNGYAAQLLGDLEGIDEFKAGKVDRISGIEVPDASTVVFRLRRGTGAGLAGALALLVTAPVPREYARGYDAKSPSTYGDHSAPTGPYRFVRYDRGRRLTLERNPAWNPDSDPRPAYIDGLEVEIGGDPNVVSRQIAVGSGMVSGTFSPSRAVLSRLEKDNPRQIATVPGVVSMLAINTTRPPLDRADVRRAIAAAIDRKTMLGVTGARYGKVASHLLPPGMPGFEEAGGLAGTEPHMRNPGGDRELAASLLRAGGGKRRTLSLVAASDPATKDAATIVEEDLRRVAVKVRVRLFSEETVYTKLCTVPDRKIDLCLVAGLPLPDQPQTFLGPLFNGKAISPVGNGNMSQLNDPEINAALDAAELLVDPQERAAAYGEIDRRIVALAAAVPLQWVSPAVIRSADVKGEVGPAGWDAAFLAVK